MKKKKKHFFLFKLKNIFSEPGNRIILLFFGIIIIASFIIYLIEKKDTTSSFKNIWDWLWWLVVTIPTVGYGDIVPKTNSGRLIGIFVIIFGVAIYTIFSGIIASILIDLRLKERRGLTKVHLKNHILIIGKNYNLEKILEALPNFLNTSSLNIVLVNEMSEEEFLDLKSKFYFINLKFVYGDYTKEPTLKRANIENGKHVIILADNTNEPDEKTILTILSIRAINQNIPIIAEVVKEEKIKPIIRAGATEVIYNGEFNPILFSSFVSYPAIPSFLKELIGNISNPRIYIEEIPERFINKNFKELFTFLRENKKIIPIGILRVEKELSINDILSGESAIDLFIKSKLEDAMAEEEEKKFNITINPSDDYIITELDDFVFYVK